MHVFVNNIHGLDSYSFHVAKNDDLNTPDELVYHVLQNLPKSLHSRVIINQKNGTCVDEDVLKNNEFLDLQIKWPLCGGKGGFGSQLKAQASRMNRNKKKRQKQDGDNDQLRTLDGNSYKNTREAKQLADYMSKKDEVQKEKQAKKRVKLEAIVNQANNEWESRQKFNDDDFLEESEDLMNDVRQATLGGSSSSSSSDTKGKGKAKAIDFFDEDYENSSEEED